MLLGRPWIHTAGVVSSILHQSVKFVWENNEVVIHGEGSHMNHPNGYVPVIEEVLKGIYFYIVEIMNAAEEDPTPYEPMPLIYNMLATVML